jgi:hypothetical protein
MTILQYINTLEGLTKAQAKASVIAQLRHYKVVGNIPMIEQLCLIFNAL